MTRRVLGLPSNRVHDNATERAGASLGLEPPRLPDRGCRVVRPLASLPPIPSPGREAS